MLLQKCKVWHFTKGLPEKNNIQVDVNVTCESSQDGIKNIHKHGPGVSLIQAHRILSGPIITL